MGRHQHRLHWVRTPVDEGFMATDAVIPTHRSAAAGPRVGERPLLPDEEV
jgi:hypothetical protein